MLLTACEDSANENDTEHRCSWNELLTKGKNPVLAHKFHVVFLGDKIQTHKTFKRMLIYYDADTQYAYFSVTILVQSKGVGHTCINALYCLSHAFSVAMCSRILSLA